MSEERNNVKRADLTTDLFRTVEHEEITWDLIQLLDHDSQLKALMEKAIAQAKAANPDPFSNPVSDLSAYYRFIDRCYRALPWQIEQSGNFDGLYDRIDQGMGLLYFIADQPLKELDEYDYFHSSLMYHEPFRSWFIRFLSLSGQFLNTEASWNEEYYQMALKNFDFHLHDGTYEAPANWKTFNDFFARRLKDANQRPIADPDDESIVISPTDSVPQGIWKIDESGRIITEYLTEKAGLSIKTGTLTDVKVLLGPSRFADAFKNGRMTHTLLDINDYHRYHFPVSGIVREVLLIPQDDAPGGVICWDADEKRYKEYFSETVGWQSIETRGVVIIETDTGGFVAVIPVGMCQVASVNFESSVVNQAAVRKGDPLGYFQFGGSDIIMLFSEDLSFELTCQNGEHLLMGKEYGRINNQNKQLIMEEMNMSNNCKENDGLKKICTFLEEAGTYYLATVEEDQPRVRPFGTVLLYEGRLYIQTGKIKSVSRQISANPKVEICAFKDGKWLRLAGVLENDDRREPKVAMLEKMPSLKGMYSPDDGNMQMLYFKCGKATFSSFTEAPEEICF